MGDKNELTENIIQKNQYRETRQRSGSYTLFLKFLATSSWLPV